jgi:hypothetical protein
MGRARPGQPHCRPSIEHSLPTADDCAPPDRVPLARFSHTELRLHGVKPDAGYATDAPALTGRELRQPARATQLPSR